MRRALARLTLCAVVLSAIEAPAGDGGDEDLAFQKSIDLLHVQMKLQVLQRLRGNGFYIPNSWMQIYLDEQQQINKDLDQGSTVDVEKLDEWAEAAEKVEKAEKDTLGKLAEDWGKKTLKALTEGADEKDEKNKGILTVWREYELKMAQWNSKDKQRAVLLAGYVQQLIGKLRENAKASGPALTDAEKFWRRDMMRLYRGAIDDRHDLIDGLKKIEKERIYTMGCLKAMREVTAGLKLMEFVQDDTSTLKSVCDKAKDQVTKYLQERYGGDDDVAKENLKWGIDKIAGGIEKSYDAWDKCSEMNKDPLLKANPLALQTCKRMAALSAMYMTVLDVAKDIVILAPLKPLFEFLEFYGKALELVPQFARAMQGMVNTVDQDVVDIRKFSVWAKVPAEQEHLTSTPLMVQYGLQIAQRGNKFYMIVPPEVMKREYVTLSGEQVQRLTQAIADERVIFALKDASRGITNMTENIFDWAPASVLAAGASPAYLKDLKEKSRKLPFSEADMVKLAQDQDIEHDATPDHKSKTWTPADFRRICEKRIDDLAEELTVRSAVPRFRQSMKADWFAFKDILREYKVVLAPQQIVHLFTFYHDGAAPERVKEYLKRTAEQRQLSRLGAARIGIPLITTETIGENLQAGSTVKLVAYAVVSDLAPGREVDATATWTFPEGMASPAPVAVKLRNGQIRAETSFVVPSNAVGKSLEAKLKIQVPLEKGEAVAEGGVIVPVGTVPKETAAAMMKVVDAGVPGKPPSPPDRKDEFKPEPAATFNEFLGTGEFSVEGGGGPVRIAVRASDKDSRTVIEVTSAVMGTLDPKEPYPAVRFKVFRAFGADEPFERASDGYAAGNTPLQKDPTLSYGRVAPDRLLISDDTSRFAEEKKPHRLIHYQVRQVLVNKDGKETGEETLSNIVRPKNEGRIRLLGGYAEDPLAPSFFKGDWCEFSWHTLRVSAVDQAFDVWDAHLVITSGAWKGHFFTGHERWDYAYGLIGVPYQAGGTTFTVTAEGEGLKVNPRTFTLAADPRHEQASKDTIKAATEEADRNRKPMLETIASARRSVEYAEGELAKAKKEKDVKRSQVIGAEHNLADWNLYLRRYTEIDLPTIDLILQEKTGRPSGNPRSSLEAMQKRLVLAKLKLDLGLAKADLEAQLYRDLGACADSADEVKRCQTLGAEQEQARKKAREEYDNDLYSLNWNLRPYALACGDAGAYKAATLAGAPVGVGIRKDMIPQMLTEMSEDWIPLTGAREAAADLREFAISMDASMRRDPLDDAQKKMIESGLPAWWPKGRGLKLQGGTFDEGSVRSAVERCGEGK